MQFTHIFFALLGNLLPVVNANFDIYTVQQIIFQPQAPVTTVGFEFFGNDPSRDNVIHAAYYAPSNDVSKSKGVRCVGTGCGLGGEPGNIDVMEMNFGNNWHFSK